MIVKLVFVFVLLLAVYAWILYEVNQAPDEDEL